MIEPRDPQRSSDPQRSGEPLGGIRTGWASLCAAGGGLLVYAGCAPRTLWWLVPVGFTLLALALRGRSTRGALALGLLFGLGYYLPLLPWVGIYVGPVPWLALAGLEAALVGLGAIGIARVLGRPGGPLWAAGVWVAIEAAAARLPFGGFPWGKVAFSQDDGPFLRLAAVGGPATVSFAVTLTGFGIAALLRARRTGRSRWVALACVVVPIVAALAAGGPVTGTRAGDQGHVTVAAVQGNVPRLGLEFNAQRRAVLDNHVNRTLQLADDVAAGRQPAPRFVLWPENASDIDPLRNPDAFAAISAAADRIGVPILVGAVLVYPDDRHTANSVLVWEPGRGPTQRNDKRRVQPFGEYLPWRGLFRLFSDYADRAGFFVAGDGPGVVDAAGVPVGVAICWEVAFDDLVADSVRNGARLLAVPTNNATFGVSEMTFQQLAMSRLRAVQFDRAVVVAATSGVSAVIAPDGRELRGSTQFVPAALVESVPLRATTTLAARLGSAPEWVLVALGLAGLCWAGRRRSRPGTTDAHDAPRPPTSERTRMAHPRTESMVVVIPTYNERENLPMVTTRIRAAVPAADILVVDDGSPDGTGELADQLAAEDVRIHVLHREAKNGLGAAYLAGFAWALARDYAVVVQMDADGSHPPETLPRILETLADADLVLGSRYVRGGSVVNWPKHREALSRGGNLYSRLALGVRVHDITAGYRAFRREVLAGLALDQVASQGYCFQIDMVWRVAQAGFRIAEYPIIFTERERGESKMSQAIVREALWRVTTWGIGSRLRRVRGASRSAPMHRATSR